MSGWECTRRAWHGPRAGPARWRSCSARAHCRRSCGFLAAFLQRSSGAPAAFWQCSCSAPAALLQCSGSAPAAFLHSDSVPAVSLQRLLLQHSLLQHSCSTAGNTATARGCSCFSSSSLLREGIRTGLAGEMAQTGTAGAHRVSCAFEPLQACMRGLFLTPGHWMVSDSGSPCACVCIKKR